MLQLIKKFLNKLLESDLAEFLVPPNCFISGKNFRIGSTDKGGEGYIENILKNAEKFHVLPSGGINTRIGFAADEESGHIVKFNHNSIGDHGIYLFDIVSELWYTVLLDADVRGGLNFDKYKLMNGAFIINHILYFNDNNNEPRKLHLGAFISGYGTSPIPSPVSTLYTISYPIDDFEITLIRKPCAFPPSIKKQADSGFNNNFIRNDSFQYAIRYVHFEGEEAVLSPWSKATILNTDSESFNYVHVFLDGTESVPQAVRLVQLIRKSLIEGADKGIVIKTWDRLISSEDTDIDNKNLFFDDYGNSTGESVDDTTLVRPFHSVPLQVGTMVPGKSRILGADNLEGYDTPKSTSLFLYLGPSVSLGFTGLTKTLISIKHKRVLGFFETDHEYYSYSAWYVYLTEVVPVGWYAITSTEQHTVGSFPAPFNPGYPVLPANPSPVAFSGLTFRGADINAVIAATRPAPATQSTDSAVNYSTGQTCTITGISTTSYSILTPESLVKGGMVFFDRYLRKCGVVFNGQIMEIPSRNYAFSVAYSSLSWAVGNSNAQTEIPDWAYYYAPVLTKNLRTRYFVASFDNATKYAVKNNTTGLLEFTQTTFATNIIAIAVNISGLLQANLGWDANDGDQCILIDNSNNRYEIPVIGSEGNYILLKPKDIGNLSGKTFVYRLYVPYKTSDQEPFFERGDIFPITNPTLITRTFSTLFGTFRSDSFALTRNYASTTYFAEAMSPNDIYFQRWDTDAGRSTLIIKQGQVRKPTGISFSNVYIQGTQTNGLSAFEALNKEILPEDIGAITKLVQVSKVQKEGSLILAIGTQEVASIYLGETQVIDATGNSFLAKSNNFIGQINILQGGFGCSNHESVIPYKGHVSWFSLTRGSFVLYSNNGVFPISDNGMKRVAKLFSDKYASLSVAQIEALGSRPFVFGGVDPYHDELYFSIPSTETTPPKGFLEDFVSANTEYDLIDVRQFYDYRTTQAAIPLIFRYYYGLYVYLPNASPVGYYAIASTEASQNNTPPPSALPPATIQFTDLIFRGREFSDVLASTMQGAYSTNETSSAIDSGYDTTLIGEMTFPYPYDIYDGRAKVLVYKLLADKWGAPHEYQTEGFIDIRNNLFSAKNGSMFKHNVNDGTNISYNQWYNSSVISAIGLIINEAPDIVKEFITLSVEGNIQPTYLHSRTERPNIQSTDIVEEWKTREGVFYVDLRRDRLSPNTSGTVDDKLMGGDKMRGQWIKIWIEFDTNSLLQIRFINCSYTVSIGHKTNIPPTIYNKT